MAAPYSLLIQFVTDERLLIPGAGTVGVRGQNLEIGPGKVGANFPYRSPRKQVEHYGMQHYVLLAAYDEFGRQIEHVDEGVRIDGGPSFIEASEASDGPTGYHEKLVNPLGISPSTENDEDEDEEEEEEEEKPKRKSSAKKRTSESRKKTSNRKKKE